MRRRESSATSATRSRFWLSSEISRPPRCKRLQEAVEGRYRAVGLFGVRQPVDQRGHELDKGVRVASDLNTR